MIREPAEVSLFCIGKFFICVTFPLLLSESQHAIDDVNNKDELVHNGCPEASINVTMSDASSFEFTVPQRNRDIGKMYLYCLIGLCKSFKGEKGSMANVKSVSLTIY